MTTIASSVFHTLQFPHQSRIFTIYHINYWTIDIRIHGSNNVPFIDDSKLSYESVGVGLLKNSSLVGNFPSSTLNSLAKVAIVHTILTLPQQSLGSFALGVVPSPIASLLPISQDHVLFFAPHLVNILWLVTKEFRGLRERGVGMVSESQIKKL